MNVTGPSLAATLLLTCLACKAREAESGTDARPADPTPRVELPAPRVELPEPKLIPRGEPLGPPGDVVPALPPAPEQLSGPDVPRTYEDGAYSVRGLREDFDAQIKAGEAGGEVMLRAWVSHIELPAPGCRGGPHCRQPHLFVTDGPEVQGPRLSMLVGPIAFELDEHEAARWADEPEVVLELGKQYLFRGKFVRFSETGFYDPRGVLQFGAYRNAADEWIYPKGAPWNPKIEALMDAENAALLERLSREAKAAGSREE